MKFGAEEISRLLPHRAPFLFVRSAEILGEGNISGRCVWDTDNPIFSAHFPRFPIVPAVLLVEAAAQVAAIDIAYRHSAKCQEWKLPLLVLATIRRATVHRPLFPGDEAEFRVALDQPVGPMFGARAEAFLHGEGEKVFKGEFVLALVDSAKLDRGS